MSSDLKSLSVLGWIGFFLGGFLLGRSIGGPDMTLSAAAFYAIAVAAFGIRAAVASDQRGRE